jgi:chorismate mutase
MGKGLKYQVKMKKNLKNLRTEIDKIDKKLKILLLKREKLIKKTAKLKKALNLKIEDKTRENKILKKIKSPFVKKTFKTIISASKDVQKRI